MQNIKTAVKKAIVNMAKKSASMEANTTCPCLGYQPKEPQAVKNCVSFEAGRVPDKYFCPGWDRDR